MSEIEFEMDIVGGGFDGTPGLRWLDDGRHPPPPAILVGACTKGMCCGTEACRPTLAHVSYWTPDEATVPPGAVSYRKQDEFIERDDAGAPKGRAVYAIGGLMDPRNFGASARVPAGSEPLVTAGFVAPRCVRRRLEYAGETS